MLSDLQLISEYSIHLRVERGLSPHTVLAYSTDLLQFAEVLERQSPPRGATLFTAGKDDVDAFLLHLESHGIQKRSRARKITALRRFYRWLIRAERLERDPTSRTDSPKLARLLPHPVEQEVLREILDRYAVLATSPGADILVIRNYAIYELLYGGGMRVSELCGLKQGDVILRAGTARVTGKGDKERIVPIGEAACLALHNYLSCSRPQLLKVRKGTQRALILSAQGKPLCRRRVHQIVIRLCSEERIYPHRLRHSCATHMLSAGGDLRAIQELLGHATIATTQIYTKVSTGHLADTHARFHPRGGKSHDESYPLA